MLDLNNSTSWQKSNTTSFNNELETLRTRSIFNVDQHCNRGCQDETSSDNFKTTININRLKSFRGLCHIKFNKHMPEKQHMYNEIQIS